jgi:uncharacterized protein (TIGR00255 family)
MSGALHSMTGFGSAGGDLSGRLAAQVRLASLNARFLEVVVRTTPRLDTTELEPAIRAVLAERIARGRVVVTVELQVRPGAVAGPAFRWEAAQALVASLAGRPSGIELAPLQLRDLLAVPGFVEGGEPGLDDGERARLLDLVAEACGALVTAREQEAAALRPQLEAETTRLTEFAAWLRATGDGLREVLLGRLRERLATLLEGRAVSEERLIQEAALLADRADTAEEVQRLDAHLAHLRRLLAEGGAVGKKLDFLLQELLREVNTAASKCREAGMGERVVEAKSALERLREQVANLE